MKSKNLYYGRLMARNVLPTYARLPMAPVRGRGSTVWDADGRKYIDFFSGLAVNNLGHAHPAIVQALSSQAGRILHSSNVFVIPEQAELASKLVRLSGLHQAFFCNSGAEAVEAAIKFARYDSIKRYGKNRYKIIVAKNSFHGRTLGALSATMQAKYQEGFGPLVPGFKQVPFNRFEAIDRSVDKSVCALLLETIQGEGGVRFPSADYFPKLRKWCDDKKVRLILDEVQVGMGRTGRLFAYEHFGIKPDMAVVSKALGSGVPIGACLVSREIAGSVRPGMHASTLGGNHHSCRVALETLKILSRKTFLADVRRKGALLLEGLHKLKKRYPDRIINARGMGLFCAITLSSPLGAEIVASSLEKGLILNAIQGNILRLIPPLIISEKEISDGLTILTGVLDRVCHS